MLRAGDCQKTLTYWPFYKPPTTVYLSLISDAFCIADIHAIIALSLESRRSQMKIFLSYSSQDKTIAGQIKWSLERFGFEVFLAHEDIEPSSEWQEAIIEQLRTCDVFIPILTNNFNSSHWTDQETGFALSRQIPIIPIDAGEKPRGFIGKYQAFRLDMEHVYDSSVGIVKIISTKLVLGKEFTNSLIETFAGSNSFAEAGRSSKLLLEFAPSFTIQQKNKILRIAASNEQIYYSFEARANLKRFIETYKDDMKGPLVKSLEEKMSL